MRALAAGLLVLLILLCAAPLASAQGGGAFGPLPPAQPETTPTPEPPGGIGGSDGDVSRETLFLIAAAVLLAFVALGVAITRDARRNLDQDDREAIAAGRPDRPGRGMSKQELARAKQRQREKTRRQKKARKKTRGANRG